MLTFILVMFIGVCMVFNIALGCYIAIRLGYGPPNWQTALNLIVRLTTLQEFLNASRYWLEQKYPKTKQVFELLRIPKPIVIVDTTPLEEEPSVEEKEEDESDENQENDEQMGNDESEAEEKEESQEQPNSTTTDEPSP